MSRALAAPPPRPGRVQPFVPTAPWKYRRSLVVAGAHTAKGLPIIIRGTLRTVLLFIGSAVYYSSFIILRCPLQHDDGQNTPGRVVSHSVTPLRRRYEWHRGRKRVLAYSCSPGSFAVLPRVYTRVCACRYTACTLVKIQSEHESAMGTFIVHSYVVLSALHYAIVFSTRPPPALLLIMRITIISLCGWRRQGGKANIPPRGFDIYIRSTSVSRDERV